MPSLEFMHGGVVGNVETRSCSRRQACFAGLLRRGCQRGEKASAQKIAVVPNTQHSTAA